jgi:fructose-1,6-bisphosphatase I
MLHLPLDGPARGPTLEAHLSRQTGPVAVVAAIANALPALAARLAAGLIPGDPAALIGTNDSGDRQKALDLGAHDHLLAALRGQNVRHVLSEEAAEVITLDPNGAWDVAIDPIDGSGSIGLGLPLGLLFAIFPSHSPAFRQSGRSVVAAGYASFGHSCDFGFSLGQGLHIATLHPATDQFHITHENLHLADQAKVIAYNASNERHWPQGLQDWLAEIRAGKDGPRGRDFNMRWLAAAVGELHRILLQGGCFLYPADHRPGYEQGRLRLMYEAIPIAFLIEQAGGKASDGTMHILDRHPQTLHENTPLIFGAASEVDRITHHLNSALKG